ncbi:MAG TPA: ATP-binding protein [Oscillatoriaceae cyanobacterium]
MQQTDEPREVFLAIPMIPDMEMAATQTADHVLRMLHFSDDQIDEVKHALIEACINAFEHSASEEDQVFVTFRIEPEALVVVIQDFGHGFEPGAVERPQLENKLGANYKRGWGLMMMESLMDAVTIESGPQGTRITMTKKRTQEALS